MAVDPSDWFMYEGASLKGRCGYCKRLVDNYDESHRVTSVMRGGKGVECVLRGDITWMEAQPLGHRQALAQEHT